MKIVIFADQIPPEGLGGAEQMAFRLATGMAGARHHVDIVTTTKKASFQDTRDGVTVHHLHAGYPIRFRAWLSLYNPQTVGPVRRLLEQIKPDVVHAHNVHLNLSYASLSVARQLGIPMVLTAHDVMAFAYGKYNHFINPGGCEIKSYRIPWLYNLRTARLRYNPLRNIIIRRILARSVTIRVAVSEALRAALEANDLPPFRMIYNGIDPNSFSARPQAVDQLRERLELQDKAVILFAGRLNELKGTKLLLKALVKIIEVVPNAMILALSAQPWRPNADDDGTIRAIFEKHVRHGGWLSGEELVSAFQLSDVLTVPSIHLEPFPTVQLEAMAAAKPIVSSCYGGTAEAIEEGKTGYVVNPFDTEAYAQRLINLLVDRSLAQHMGAAGHQRLLDLFSLERQVAQTTALYEEAVLSVKS